MCSRVVTLLLLPAFLLSQWMVMCRCHGGCRAAGPDARPHVHLNGLILGSTPKKCRCCQQTGPASEAEFERGATSLASATSVPEENADHGILYLAPSVVYGSTLRSSCENADDLSCLTIPTCEPSVFCHFTDGTALPVHRPPLRRPSCRRIYILTLALLI